MRLEVAVAAPLEQTLSYRYLPQEYPFPDQNPVGKRVLVTLGRRRVTGYVLATLPEEETDYVEKPVLEVLDRQPLFHQNAVAFFRWIAKYYHYPIGEVIKTALPAGLSTTSAKTIELTDLGKENIPDMFVETAAPQSWLAPLLDRGMLSPSASRKVIGDKTQKKILQKLQRLDYVTISEKLLTDSVKVKEEICYRLGLDLEVPLRQQKFDSEAFAQFFKQLKEQKDEKLRMVEAKTIYYIGLLGSSTGNDLVPRKELIRAYSGASGVLQGLVEKKLITRSTTRIYRDPFGDQFIPSSRPESLTPEQQEVLHPLVSAIQSRQFETFLLHGITGSGKTEVYLQAAETTLNQGRDVLVLVPEIALATQLESHFVSRFGDLVVLLHSGLSAGERFDQWSLAASGRAKIVIGARSAVFAPLKEPGLIVVDEEHDAGYKQDESLRYQGRDLAILRARHHGAVVLLGSATPDITSYRHAMMGKYHLLQMTRRVAGRPLPEVSIVDLRKRPPRGEKGIFSSELHEALQTNLDRNEQSLLLINRRGFSSSLLCRECGTPVECRHCHVSLVYHKNKQRLICHYCGYTLTHKLICAKCGSDTLVPIGFGTERLEEEVRSSFPSARVARVDSDTASDRKKFLQVLGAMHNREIDILIGTQMVAKGHHFPLITLVGVVWADGGLHMPDFRAAERTFQLISQVTGRAGRGDNPGRVIIQTMQPDHYAIVFSKNHKYQDLFEQEMSIRRTPFFPPYVRLIALLIQGPDEEDVRKTAFAVTDCCRKDRSIAADFVKDRVRLEVLGPAPAPLDRLCDQYRWQILLKGRQVEELHRVCSIVKAEIRRLTVGMTRIVIDVDPENMM